jgi:hypothetical protein
LAAQRKAGLSGVQNSWSAQSNLFLHSAFSILHLPPVSQPFGEAFGQAGGDDFFLGGGNVVFKPAEFNRAGVHVINDVGGLGIVVARLADGSDIDEI